MLREFAEKQSIPFPLLSDVDSEVIRRYGILNEQVRPGDALLYGIPYPGSYVTDGDGIVVARSFHDSYKMRDSPEILLDAALGRVELEDDGRAEQAGDDEVRVTAAVHGGEGTIRQGIVRQLVVRFELAPGLHIYGEPVPEGMIPTTVSVSGPPGFVAHEPIRPPTRTLRLEALDVELEVWDGPVDFVVPFHATGELASEVRPLDEPSVPIEVEVRFQACDDQTCLLPRTEKLTLDVPLDVVDIPKIAMHAGHGQREGLYDGAPHMKRLMRRKIREAPLGFLRFVLRSIALELGARLRRLRARP